MRKVRLLLFLLAVLLAVAHVRAVACPTSGNATINVSCTLNPGSYSYDLLVINFSATVTAIGNVTASGFPGVQINATNITINGTLTADGQGFGSVGGPGAGATASDGGGGGGGYGGKGGDGGVGALAGVGSGGSPYGNGTNATFLGSGGGNETEAGCGGTRVGGAGGGAIMLNVSDTIIVNGNITAIGTNGTSVNAGGCDGAGAGSGGSIIINASIFSGSGIINVTGGIGGAGLAGSSAGGGGGGGGRILIVYNTSSFSGRLAGFGQQGGSGTLNNGKAGDDGTVTINNFVNTGSILCDTGSTHETTCNMTSRRILTSGNTYVINTLNILSGGFLVLRTNNVSTITASSFDQKSGGQIAVASGARLLISSTNTTMIFNGSTNVSRGTLNLTGDIVISGLMNVSNALDIKATNLTITGIINLSNSTTVSILSDKILLSGNISTQASLATSIFINENVTGQGAVNISGIMSARQMNITIARVNIPSNGLVLTEARGDVASQGSGNGSSPSDGGGGGAGYGGAGGNGGVGLLGGSGTGGTTYGSNVTPSNLGSGGGTATEGGCTITPTGGTGGGAVRMVIGDNITVNGRISASGQNGTDAITAGGCDAAGGGSGGSIFITTLSFEGSGTVEANGGHGGNATGSSSAGGGGGGGGRIAINFTTNVFEGTVRVINGTRGRGTLNNGVSGTNGTIVFQQNPAAAGLNITGNEASVTTSGVANLNITRDGIDALNGTLSGLHFLEFFDGSTFLMNVTWNATNTSFNLSRVLINRTSTSLVVNISGQGVTKSLFLFGSFTGICIKDVEMTSVQVFTYSCIGTNETFFTPGNDCPGVKNGINCTVVSGGFKFSNLSHSGAEGSPGGVNTPISGGNVTITIESEATANLTDAVVTFSTGVVVAPSAFALLDTNGNNNNWNGAVTQDGMEVVNDGNVALNITVKASKNSSSFICEGENYLVNCGRNISFPPNFSFWADLNESNGSLGDPDACGGAPFQAAGSFFRGGNRTNPREFATANTELVACENLSPASGFDKFVLEFYLRIPDDAFGTKNNTITITARTTA